MSLLKRTQNLASFLTWPRIKAGLGLLSSDARHAWIQTIGTPHLSGAPLDNIYPWFSFPSIYYLNNLVSPHMKVLEYGCGYSTIWWAKRVSSVVSVERSTHWLEEVRQALSKHSLANVQLLPFQRFSGNTEEDILAGQDIAGLAPIIRDYATLGNAEPESYDVVVIDDIFRNETASAGVALVKPGGLLILDDSERERYQPTVNLLRELGWSFSSFYGVSPYHFHEKQTTIWHKPIYSQ